MRASHADRERVIDTVKAAFARGQLTAGELDARVGQALTARTYTELAAVTLSIPARSNLSPPTEGCPGAAAAAAEQASQPGRLHDHGHHACGRGLGWHCRWRCGGSNSGDVHAQPRGPGHTSVTSVPADAGRGKYQGPALTPATGAPTVDATTAMYRRGQDNGDVTSLWFSSSWVPRPSDARVDRGTRSRSARRAVAEQRARRTGVTPTVRWAPRCGFSQPVACRTADSTFAWKAGPDQVLLMSCEYCA